MGGRLMQCKICSAELAPPKKAYCGKQCARQGNLNNALAAYHGAERRVIRRRCVFCSAEFVVTRNQKICLGSACAAALRRRQNKNYVAKYRREDLSMFLAKQREYQRRSRRRKTQG